MIESLSFNTENVLILNNRQQPFIFISAIFVAFSLAHTAYASEMDHDRARKALEAGQILPLRVIREKIELQYPGQVLEVELEKKHLQWIYEFKILQPPGKLIKLKIDASNGVILKQK